MGTVTWGKEHLREVFKDEYRLGCGVVYSKPQNLADSTEMVWGPAIAYTPVRLVYWIQKPSHRCQSLRCEAEGLS